MKDFMYCAIGCFFAIIDIVLVLWLAALIAEQIKL